MTNCEKGCSKSHLSADNFCGRTTLRFSRTVLLSDSSETLATKFREEKERQMSRQTRSKSSSDFVRREKTDKGETRESCMNTRSVSFRVFLRFLIYCRLSIGTRFLPCLRHDIIYRMPQLFVYVGDYPSCSNSQIVKNNY